MKAIKILSDIKLSSDNMSLELHPNCTLDDVYQGIEEINKIISSKNNFKEYGFEADFEGEILKQKRTNMLYEEFVEFLKENKAYINYMRNAGYVSDEEIDIHDSYFEAFHWDSTPEGYDYWNNLDTDWFDLIMAEDF